MEERPVGVSSGDGANGECFFTGPAEDRERYRVTEVALSDGQVGGEGIVYHAREVASGQEVALKVLTRIPMSDFDLVAGRSAHLEQLRHPNLMEQIETFVGPAFRRSSCGAPAEDHALHPDHVDEDADVMFSVAAWVDGSPVTDVVGLSSGRDRLTWVCEIAEALACLHEFRSEGAPNGLVHRDVKPSNIRIRADDTAVLLDFGVARPVEAMDMTEGVGTYLWRAPEVLSGREPSSGAAVDAWGLGAVAHWMLLDNPPPLDGPGAARERLLRSFIMNDFRDRPAVAEHIAALLHPDPAQRPDDLRAWASEMRRIIHRKRSRVRLTHAIRSATVPLTLMALGAFAAVVVLAGWRSPTTPEPVVAAATRDRTASHAVEPSATTLPTTLPTTTSAEPLPSSNAPVERPTGSAEIECEGHGATKFRADPPIGMQPRTVIFTLDGPSATFECPGPVVSAVIQTMEVTFDDVSCSTVSLKPTRGVATILWNDGSTFHAGVEVQLTDPSHGSFVLRGTSGLHALRAVAYFGFSGSEGSCAEGGITGELIQVDSMQVFPNG